MIVHVTMAKYKEKAASRSRQENIQRVKGITEGLQVQIPSMKRVEVGINMLNLPNSYDVVSSSAYDNMDAFHALMMHPAHDELVSFQKETVEFIHMVTYEM